MEKERKEKREGEDRNTWVCFVSKWRGWAAGEMGKDRQTNDALSGKV